MMKDMFNAWRLAMPIKDFDCECGYRLENAFVDADERPICPKQGCGKSMTVAPTSFIGQSSRINGHSYKNGYNEVK